MSDALAFETAKRRRDTITFTLDGDTYHFTPPKKAGMVLEVSEGGNEVKALFDWLDDGLPTEEAEYLENRLRDPDDDLDVDTLTEVVAGLLEKVSGRPTRPSRASRRRR